MDDIEFQNWAKNHGLTNQVINALSEAAARVDEDTLVGRAMLDFAGIVECTDEIIVNACPFDAGFVVFGDCPNGDPIAIDVRNDVGTIHYLSHEESDGNSFPSLQVAHSMERFLELLAVDKMPTDYHEAIGWDFSKS